MTTVFTTVPKTSNVLVKRLLFVGKKFFTTAMSTSTNYHHDDIIQSVGSFIPHLSDDLHKGQCGRIGVIGGSEEYTGAPYFAAMSALKTGADLVYIFCCRGAAPVIKAYSPELIVLPILDSQNVVADIQPWMSRIHTLVIGPGLGRNTGVLKNVESIIEHCKEKVHPSIPLIIDADGLYLITKKPNLLHNYKGAIILTPNIVEFDRLANKLNTTEIINVASELNAVIVKKGLKDFIVNGIQHKMLDKNSEITAVCDVRGSNRRCGGQGDILAGCMAAFVAWCHLHQSKIFKSDHKKASTEIKFFDKFLGYGLPAYAACSVIRSCSQFAFEEFGRSMTASDMISFIGKRLDPFFKKNKI